MVAGTGPESKIPRQGIFEIPVASFTRDNARSVKKFQTLVLIYYENFGRDLVWRKTTDPYSVMVSEIMLQQTQVGRVVQKYPVFLEAFPDFPSLAGAPLEDILAVWQGMGYNRRAIALKHCAQRVETEFAGKLPADAEVLASFPGIGTATASSICAFAFNQPVVFIETNIRRVFIHFFFGDQVPVHDSEIVPLVRQALYRQDPRTWYNALMDLGTDLKATVPNPNRRSRHYTRQGAFKGSDREMRGRIISLLLEEKRLSLSTIIKEMSDDPVRIDRILKNLEDEGFIARSGSFITFQSR